MAVLLGDVAETSGVDKLMMFRVTSVLNAREGT
jgi:hypothetical protein